MIIDPDLDLPSVLARALFDHARITSELYHEDSDGHGSRARKLSETHRKQHGGCPHQPSLKYIVSRFGFQTRPSQRPGLFLALCGGNRSHLLGRSLACLAWLSLCRNQIKVPGRGRPVGLQGWICDLTRLRPSPVGPARDAGPYVSVCKCKYNAISPCDRKFD